MVERHTNAAGELYAPLTDGLYYWNETMATDSFQLIAETQDYNGNGIIDFPADTTCARPYGRYGWSATSRPSVGIDASGTMYVTYMALIESAVHCVLQANAYSPVCYYFTG